MFNDERIETRSEDAATYRVFIRTARDHAAEQVEKASPIDAEDARRAAIEADLAAERVAGGTGTEFTGPAALLAEAADLLLADLIAQAAELAGYAPLAHDRLERLAESIAWWSPEAARLNAAAVAELKVVA